MAAVATRTQSLLTRWIVKRSWPPSRWLPETRSRPEFELISETRS